MKNNHTALHKNQNGLVSIMVTVIIMVMISLIVMGFARVVRREQRQALDRQLSTQAFYAAESGINAAIDRIRTAAGPLSDKTTCPPNADFPGPYDIDTPSGVAYTCLLVDQTPPTLEYDNIDTSHSTIIPITPATAGNLESIKLSWQEKDGGVDVSGCPAAGSFPADPSWPATCQPGVLRVDLVPSSGTFSRQDLISKTMTAFFYPSSGGSATFGYGSAVGFGSPPTVGSVAGSNGQGAVVAAQCTGAGPKVCNVTITGLSASGYHMRVRSIYNPNALTVSALLTGGAPTDLTGNQALIDSTGKANDVLRRVQARVPTRKVNDTIPDFAIESVDTLCKRFRAAPGIVPITDIGSITDPANPCGLR